MNILLLLLSVCLVCIPWYGITSLTLLVAFVPLLMIQHRTNGRGFVWYAIVFLLCWNFITTWWIAKAALIGVFAGSITTTIIFATVLGIYNHVWKRAGKPLAYVILATGWVAAERLYLNGEISFPWLVIGNGFGIDVKLIQWYEYLGTLGGSMWVLIANLLVFTTLTPKQDSRITYTRKQSKGPAVWSALFILIPIIISFYMYYSAEKREGELSVAVLQPNINPYTEKFGSMSEEAQRDTLLSIAARAPQSTKVFIAPETALDGTFWQESLPLNSTIDTIRNFIKSDFPQSSFITGITSLRFYPKEGGVPTTTARLGNGFYYDIFNSAIQIDSTLNTPIYHKSKLVIGVEMLPYHEYLGFISALSVDLGGISGMLGSQKERTLFNVDSHKVGVAICYESIYGEYFTEYIKKGAEVMFVITNDGWWDNTPGYEQHLSYSRLRAVETRRAIARSANTGVSAFISQRGEILSSLGWDVRGLISENITLNNEITFFVKYGDMIGRLSSYTFLLSLLYYIAFRRKLKDHLYKQ